ncbi:MAG: substrate-binding domain-containing protein, partial [Propionivibrio sp.]
MNITISGTTRLNSKFIGRAATLCLTMLAFMPVASAETLVIPGSGNPEYILKELANAYNHQQTRHRVVVPPTIGTSGALREVTEGTATMGRVGRPLKDTELSLGLTYRAIGRDPVAFVGGAGVTVSSVSAQQAIDIFAGKIVNWRDLGGKPGTIRAIGREKTDASLQGITRGIKAFENLQYHDNVKIVHLDTQLIELLDRFPASFGFLNRSALSGAKTKLMALQLDSIEPNADNVDAGRYPLWT